MRGGHLDDEDVARLLDGRASGTERAAVDRHVDDCEECRRLLVEIARGSIRVPAESTVDRGLADTLPCVRIAAPYDSIGDPTDVSPPPQPESSRYQLIEVIGRGGMGEVLAVRDLALDREVALKRVRGDKSDPGQSARFVQEARLLASLEHPSIIPLHDAGRLESGEVFFTMKKAGRYTLADLVVGLKQGDAELARIWTTTRLSIAFLHVVEAIAYAHARGVLHCDLKPANILVGAHREILVADWGLAKKKDDAVAVPIEGTPLYLAPERLTGRDPDERCDIYSLGAILYELLTLDPPVHAPTYQELLIGLFAKEIVPPKVRRPDRDIPDDLDRLAMRCLARRPEERPESAEAVRTAIEQVLAGERLRETASERFAAGKLADERWQELAEQEAALEAERKAAARTVKSWDPESKKRPLWDLEERLFQLRLSRDEALSQALDGYGQAIAVDPRFTPARDRFADLQLMLFLEAEANGDRRAELLHRRQVELHHRGRHEAVLAGTGRLEVLPQAGKIARVTRLIERGKKHVAQDPIPIGERMPMAELESGSWLFEVEAEGAALCRVHVFLERGQALSLRPRPVSKAIATDRFVHVPAGPFIRGGDRRALNSVSRARIELPDFLIARYPVTCAEYLEFLNSRAPHLASRHVPRTKPEGGALWEQGRDGRYSLPRHDADGNPVLADAPVMGVSFFDAQAFASWRAEVEGRPIRLPTEDEWEKAARGADGRFFPWGNGFDAAFCKMALSRPGRPQPEPVGSFPADESVYGMRDAAGGIREWCDSWYDDAEETRVLRGGAWYFNADYCRLAFRHGYLPHIVFTNFGIRIACSL